MTTQTRSRPLKGAHKVIGTCLGLLPGQELLIVADDTTLQAAHLLHKAATEEQVHATMVLVPLDEQIRLAKYGEFPLLMQAAMRDAKAILTCVSDQSEAMNFRAGIIRMSKGSQTKIGNCPGLSLEMLSTAVNVDYSHMVRDCNLLAMVLVRSRELKIITEDSQNKAHELNLSLGGWERIPVTSTGIIEEGVWGNIPSGETYLAPMEDLAEGEIVINGSIPGHVLPEGHEITLTFQAGEMVHIRPANSPAAQLLQSKLEAARSAGDSNCHRLAEVGIGVNSRISKLTGKPLMDEKKADTAHIALGQNKDFGGVLSSSVHLDLVTERPSIIANGKSIMEHGQLTIREPDWRDSYLTAELPEEWITAVEAVSRTGHKANPRSPRLLQRELIDGSGRVLYLSVGDNLTATAAMSLYNSIPTREPIRIAALQLETGQDPGDMLKLLKVMQDYEMVKVHGPSK